LTPGKRSWIWDKGCKSNHIQIKDGSKGLTVVKKGGGSVYSAVCGNQAMTQGIHKWTVKANNSQWILIGMVDKVTNTNMESFQWASSYSVSTAS